jgi:hypothetical protein
MFKRLEVHAQKLTGRCIRDVGSRNHANWSANASAKQFCNCFDFGIVPGIGRL